MSIQRQEGEGMTEFTIRRIRAEIIEECAKLVDDRADHARKVTSAFAYSGSKQSAIAGVIQDIATDIRALALPRPHLSTQENPNGE